MSVIIEKLNSPISYHLYNEDVALDTLLDLCSKKQVAIKDIFISDITSQFISYIETLDNRDYEEISNFLILAATLLEIKSSELLPKIDFEDINPDELSDADLFILRTEEYSLYRNVANKLQEMEILHRFYRSPEYDQNDYKIIIKNFNIDKMILAFTNLLENVEFSEDSEIPKTIPLERFTVADRMRFIIEYLNIYKESNILVLFEKGFSKLEIINTFLAILELVKESYIELSVSGDDLSSIGLSLMDKGKMLVQEEELFKDVEVYS
jgi:segregation and condensation protein A